MAVQQRRLPVYMVRYPSLNATILDVEICESPSGTVNLSALMIPNTVGGFNLDGTTPGGVWTATGVNVTVVSISNDVLTYTIPSGSLGPYSINVSYTLTGLFGAPAPCDVATDAAVISISGATETGFDLPSTWCEDNGNINLASYTAVGGGTWYLMSENGAALVPPTNLGGTVAVGGLTYVGGASVLEIRYQPGEGGCGVPMTEFITVNSSVVADLLAIPNTFCIGATDNTLPFNLTAYYTRYNNRRHMDLIGPNATAVSGTTFNPSIAGTYVLTYSVSNGVCSDSESIVVTKLFQQPS